MNERRFTGEDLEAYLDSLPKSDPDLENETVTHNFRNMIEEAKRHRESQESKERET